MYSKMTFVAMRTRAIAVSGRKGNRAAAGLLALLACFGRPSASHAVATPFQQYVSIVCGDSDTYCEMAFARPPVGKRLEMNNVSCYLRGNKDPRLSDIYLTIKTEANSWRHTLHLAPEQIAEGDETTVFSASHSLFAYANSGERVYLLAIGKQGAFRQFACHISGWLVDR